MRSFQDGMDDPEENELLGAILSRTLDLEARRVYGAWLSARGDARAELVAAVSRLIDGESAISDDERRGLALRVVELAAGEDELWLMVIAQPFRTVNCGARVGQDVVVRFAFKCDQSWMGMAQTDDARIRVCSSCKSAVVRCDTVDEAERQARLGACIAVDIDVIGEAYRRDGRKAVGRPDIVAMWAQSLFRGR